MNNSNKPVRFPGQQQSIQARLLVSLGGTLVITLLIIVGGVYLLSANIERTNWQERELAVSRIASQQISGFIAETRRTLTFLANRPSDERLAEQTAQLLAVNPGFLELIVTDAQGRVEAFAAQGETEAFAPDSILQADWYSHSLDSEDSDFYLEVSNSTAPYLVISMRTADGGVAAASFDQSFLSRILAEIRFGESGSAYVADADGLVIAHTDSEIVRAQTTLAGRPEFPAVTEGALVSPAGETVLFAQKQEYVNVQGIPVIGTVTAIDGTGWLLFTEISQSEALATSRSIGLPLAVFAVLFWGGAMLSTVWVIRSRVFAPLARLQEGQAAVALGDLEHQVEVTRPDEIGALTVGFNSMVRELQQRTQDQRHAEAALRESEKRYRELVENARDIVYTVDLKGRFTYVSPAAAAVTGYPEAQLIGKHFTELIDPDWRERVAGFYINQIKNLDPETTLEFPIITPAGETRWVEQKVIPVYDGMNKIAGFEGIVRDITGRKESDEKLRALYTVMAQPSLTIDEQLTQALKIGTEILGLSIGIISQIEGDAYTLLYTHSPDGSLQPGQQFEFRQTYCEMTYQADDLVTIEAMGASPHRNHPCYGVFGLEAYIGVPLRVNGERFGTLSFSSTAPHEHPFSAADRDFFSLMGRWVSLTLERKLALEELSISEANMRSLFDNTPAIITKVDRECRVEFIRVPGVDADLLMPFIGQSFLSLIPSEYHATAQDALAQMFAERRNVQYETISVDPRDGLEHWYSTTAAPIIEGDDVTAALLISTDISERKQAERQIQAQNEALVKTNRELALSRRQAEVASKLKSQFLATMSHELRTPLNAVIGYSQLQLAGMAGEMTPEQTEFQERILVNAQHLLQLINEVLDISKIEAGRMELAEKPFDLRECVDEVVLQNAVLAENKGLAFALNFDDRLPEIIVGDRGRIKQVLINLVSNAIKFTDQGSVTIDVVLYNKESWRVTVTDTGVGIASHLQETIFDEFRQAEHGIERGGTGLGLAIVRKLVLMMGGNIRLTSEIGYGSIFIVTLPLITEAASEAIEA